MATLELNLRPSGFAEVGRAERSLDGLKRSASDAERRLGGYVDATGRVRDANGRLVSAQDQVTRSLGRSNNELSRWSRGAVAALAAVTAAATGFSVKSIAAYRTHNEALAEVGTLLDGNVDDLDRLDAAAQRYAEAFGGTATQQVQAFYQAISAGVGDVADATEFLESANVLALAGVTDITTSVDLLTTVTNAYASSGLKAAEASDVLFTGVRVGKTTVDELSSALGQVVPIASSVGVTIDEVTSGIAALTSQGQSTSQAVTGIRATLAALIKPSSEAADLAQSLGIEFNTAALQARGFGGVIEDVRDATGNNQQSLATLFGSVEALNAVLALTGDAGDVYEAAMLEMAGATGAAQRAADSVGDSLENRLNKQLAILGNAGLRVGEALLRVVVPALEFATSRTEELSIALVGIGAAVSFVFPVVGAVTAIAGAITFVIARWDTFRAVGEVVLERISSATGITADAVATTWEDATTVITVAWNLLLDSASFVLNKLIGSANATYTVFTELFPQLPKVVGSAVIDAVNFVISGVENMVQSAIDGLNRIVDGINSAGEIFGIDQAVGRIGDVNLGRVDNPFEGIVSDSREIINTAVSQLGEDYVGEFFKGFDQAIQRRKGENADQLDPRNGVFIPSPPTSSGSTPSFDVPELPAEVSSILEGLGGGGAARQATESLSDLRGAFDSLVASMDPTYQRSLRLAEGLQTIKDALDAGVISTEEAANATQLLQRELNGIDVSQAQTGFSNFFRGILTGSQSAVGALSDLAARIADRSLTEGLDQLFARLSSLGSVGGGGFLSGLLNFVFSANGNVFDNGSLVPFANGGAFQSGSIVPFESGTVISQPTFFPLRDGRTGLMGEAGPEAIMPLRRGSDGKLGVAAGGGGAAPNVNLKAVVVDDMRNLPDALQTEENEQAIVAIVNKYFDF